MNKYKAIPLMLCYAMLCYGSMFHQVECLCRSIAHSTIAIEIADFIFLPGFHLPLDLASGLSFFRP